MTRVLLLGAAGRMGCAVQSAAQAMPDITVVFLHKFFGKE